MTDRRGVLLLLFDIPSQTKEEQKAYRKFKKHIINNGYVFIQKSVYAKLISNTIVSGSEINRLKNESPEGANISVLPLSLTKFSKIKNVCGFDFDFSFFCDDIIYL